MSEPLTPEDERKAALARRVAPLLIQLVEAHRRREQDAKDAA